MVAPRLTNLAITKASMMTKINLILTTPLLLHLSVTPVRQESPRLMKMYKSMNQYQTATKDRKVLLLRMLLQVQNLSVKSCLTLKVRIHPQIPQLLRAQL